MVDITANRERDFHYLLDKYTEPGAREVFERLCTALMQVKYGNQAHSIRVSQGDGGIDVMVGDFSGPVRVFQCKFFLEKSHDARGAQILDGSRKSQVKNSFGRAWKNQVFTMSEWNLCLPCVLSESEMAWWSEWKSDMEELTSIPIHLYDGGNLLAELKQHGLYDQAFDIDLSNTLDDLKKKLDLLIASNDDPNSDLDNLACVATILDAKSIAEAASAYSQPDSEKFYMVDTSFSLMLRIVCADQDVPHVDIHNRLRELFDASTPAILTGNSGSGKSTIMLRSAVEWVRRGGMALWVRLGADDPISDSDARQFYASLLRLIPQGQRVLLCLDNPSEHPDSFRSLANRWPDDSRIQLVLSERSNRLSRLTDANCDFLHHWFDDASVITMFQQGGRNFFVKNYAVEYFPDTYFRKMEILNRAVPILIKKGSINRSPIEAVKDIMRRYNQDKVGLIELLYSAQFYMQRAATKPQNLRLDWDEWQHILKKELKSREDAQDVYGVVALCSVFGIPMRLDAFCSLFCFERYTLIKAIRKWRMSKHVEPVIYHEPSDTLCPKHDVIAELFFRFHRGSLPHDELMLRILDAMDEYDIEGFLSSILHKKPLQNRIRYPLKNVNYRKFLSRILARVQSGTCGLSVEAKTRLGLGLLYTVPRQDHFAVGRKTLAVLENLNVPMAPNRLTASFYTEWGILAAKLKQNVLAEEKFRNVAEQCPNDIQSRTELGRLLMKLGRDGEAEAVLREVIRIDPDNIMSRTELGRLLMKLGRDGEAEAVLREVIRIDPDNIMSRTELGKLLMKLDRAAEAEGVLRKAFEIEPTHIQSRTELGRLLMKLGRDGEAEAILREALQIDPQNLHPHTELGRLLIKLGQDEEAEAVLRKAFEIEPTHIQSRTELAKLCSRTGRLEEARTLYQEVLRLNPGDEYALRGLAHLNKHP